MSALTIFLLRHKVSGYYMPEATGRSGRGGSWKEFCDPGVAPPRIFRSRLSASRFLSSWCRGRVSADRRYWCDHEGMPDFEESIDIVPGPGRNKSDVEIVEREVAL